MRKTLVFVFCGLAVLLLLQNCKPDKIEPPAPPVDADSLYTSTPYSFSSITPPLFRFPKIRHPYKDSLTYEGIELGRRLFYDKHLSINGQLSCASCHKQEFAFSDGGNAKSINVLGPTRRNAPAIQNLLWTEKLFWDGRAGTLSAQAKDAFAGEQNMDVANSISYLKSDSTYARLFRKAFGRPGDITETKIYLALQQFMMTLISSNSHFDKVQRGQEQFTESEARGLQLFTNPDRGDCTHCHVSDGGSSFLMTDNLFRNNGLDEVANNYAYTDKGRGEFTGNVNDNGKFKDPTLRNIALTGPYMHDGRYATLDDVLNFYSDSVKNSGTVDVLMFSSIYLPDGKRHFTEEEHQDLLNFLNAFTDTTFTHNTAFSNPF